LVSSQINEVAPIRTKYRLSLILTFIHAALC
jgi:hypothetical protein